MATKRVQSICLRMSTSRRIRKTSFCLLCVVSVYIAYTGFNTYDKSASSTIPIDTSNTYSSLSNTVKEYKNKEQYIETDAEHNANFQHLGDNATAVYVGYYDDRENQAVVKIITIIIQKKARRNFTCSVHYPDKTVVKGTGYFRLLKFMAFGNMTKHRYRDGFITCPVSRTLGRPSYILLTIDGLVLPATRVLIKPPSKKTNMVTRCLKEFLNNYDNVAQLIWNIEFFRILGVDKQIFYLKDQSQRVLNVLQSYEREGIVELRNFRIEPSFIDRQTNEISAFEDCFLSEMNTAKYILFLDLDEILTPRKHDNIIDLADFLFNENGNKSEHIGSLRFKFVLYPAYTNITNISFPQKDLAQKYHIDPLLHTDRYRTAPAWNNPKTLIKPKAVDFMFIHYVQKFMKGWRELIVDEDIATVNHYRLAPYEHIYPPITADIGIYKYSDVLISSVKHRFEKNNMLP